MPIRLPPIPRKRDHYNAASLRLPYGRLLPQPDYVFCLMGIKVFEVLKPGILWKIVDISDEHARWLEEVRVACPSTPVFCVTPPWSSRAGEIAEAVKASYNGAT